MKKPRLTRLEIAKIVRLRKFGYSFSEIQKAVSKSKSIIHKYAKDVVVTGRSRIVLDLKQNGSKTKIESKKDWDNSKKYASEKLGRLSTRDFILIGSMLYWGEGSKTNDLNLINSDSTLIKVFVNSLLAMGVLKSHIKISLRLYDDINENEAVDYWLKELNLSKTNLVSINYLYGKKTGKLKYGMCRLRVKSGGLYFKRLMSIIDYVKSRCSSTDRMAHS